MFLGISCGGEWWGLDTFRRVERLGFDGLFTGEHLLFHRATWDAVTMCAAMAAVTERIAIGPAATIAPLRHPTLLAKEFAGIDRIANGRLLLCLGVGGDYPQEFAANDVPLERKGRRTEETVEILRRYFSGERFSYEGELFRLEDVWIDPPPARPGGPPIWLAGRREHTIRRAGRLADGWLPYMVTPQSMARTFAGVREAAEGAGRELPQGFAWGVYLHVAYGEDPDEARRRADEHLAWRYAEPRFLGDLAGKYAIGGDADGVAEAIMRYVEAGATHVIAFPILREGQRIEDGLDELAGAVLPAVRAAAGR
jgi:alkanesulfonate monooxygenase SsuD/methylene tetrahydromethanopterin reductase-like flavin-dependent oxidoreductase (luciferase family)